MILNLRLLAKVSSSTDIPFGGSEIVPTRQKKILGSANNKYWFISTLYEKLESSNYKVEQAQNDADVLMIETEIKEFERRPSIVILVNVDLLVILISTTFVDIILPFPKARKAKIETEYGIPLLN